MSIDVPDEALGDSTMNRNITQYRPNASWCVPATAGLVSKAFNAPFRSMGSESISCTKVVLLGMSPKATDWVPAIRESSNPSSGSLLDRIEI